MTFNPTPNLLAESREQFCNSVEKRLHRIINKKYGRELTRAELHLYARTNIEVYVLGDLLQYWDIGEMPKKQLFTITVPKEYQH